MSPAEALLKAAQEYRDAYEAVRDSDSEIELHARSLREGIEGAEEALVAARRERYDLLRVRSITRHRLWRAIEAARVSSSVGLSAADQP